MPPVCGGSFQRDLSEERPALTMRLNTKEKASVAALFLYLCFLTAGTMCLMFLSPHHEGLHIQSMSQIKPFLKMLSYVFAIAKKNE